MPTTPPQRRRAASGTAREHSDTDGGPVHISDRRGTDPELGAPQLRSYGRPMTITADPAPPLDDTLADRTPARRPARRHVRLAAAAIALTLGVAAAQMATDATADGPAAIRCTEPVPAEAAPLCDGLWGQIRALGLPEDEWASAAEALGLFPRGEWISDDGLRWEHLDGTTYVVATPRSSGGR